MNEASPENLLSYFQRLAATTGRQQYVDGADLTFKWIELRGADHVPETQFRELLDRIELPLEPPGSGWFDLWLQFVNWGYQRGFSVPDDHPWRVDPNCWRCRACGPYKDQIVVEKMYTIVKRNDQSGLIRLVNEHGKTRWYPMEHFEEPRTPMRNWLRKNG